MILIDTNLLVYAANGHYPTHARAKSWLDSQLNAVSRTGMPWHSLLGFVRLSSDRRWQPNPPSVDEAWDTVRRWLALPNVWVPASTERHADVISNLIATSKIHTKDVMDIHLAALAIEHGLTLCSADAGFERYRGLRLLNPLIA